MDGPASRRTFAFGIVSPWRVALAATECHPLSGSHAIRDYHGPYQGKLSHRSPARYRPQLPPLRDGVYTLLKFRSAREDVVLSRVVADALSHVQDEAAKLVAVGGSFTLEGAELLRARNAVIMQLSDFGWSDDRFIAIRGGGLGR